MTSDEERREVAQKLREACDEIERTGNGLTVWELTDILSIRDDDSGMVESLNLDDARNLADLIDRPTCNDVGDDWEFHCSACGCELDIREMEVGEPTMWKDGAAQVPKYCPSCGAEVVSND